jgi:hypothetical protein
LGLFGVSETSFIGVAIAESGIKIAEFSTT